MQFVQYFQMESLFPVTSSEFYKFFDEFERTTIFTYALIYTFKVGLSASGVMRFVNRFQFIR
jgi:hypothetical protein